jgi:hypothetical protein
VAATACFVDDADASLPRGVDVAEFGVDDGDDDEAAGGVLEADVVVAVVVAVDDDDGDSTAKQQFLKIKKNRSGRSKTRSN